MKRVKKSYIIGAVIVILVLAGLFIGLGMDGFKKEQGSDLSTLDPLKKPLVGFCIDTMVIERWQKDKDRFTAKAEELGYEVKVANAYEDSSRQIQQIRDLIAEGAVAIVIIAFDKEALADVVDEAKREGVVVIAYDRMTTNANVDAYVSFDNVKVGELMATYLVEAAPKGNYVIINGSPADHNATMFNAGYYNILQPYIDSGDIVIVEEVWATMWREEIAYDAVINKLQEGVTIDGIIGANDRLAEAAISALAEKGLAGQVPVVGHDADISACQRIVKGTQLMTVYKPIKNLAEGAVSIMETLLENGTIEGDQSIGEYQVPYIKFDVVPVTKDNMRETVIADYFHTEEDVYREENEDKDENEDIEENEDKEE